MRAFFGYAVPSSAALIIVSGHRCVAASLKAGLTDIHGTFTDSDTRLQGFVDNLQREGLPPIDEAEQMADLMTEYVYKSKRLQHKPRLITFVGTDFKSVPTSESDFIL